MSFNELNLLNLIKDEKNALLGNVRKDLNEACCDKIIVQRWNDRKFYDVNQCRTDIRRNVIRKHFQLKVKTLNTVIPACQKLIIYDSQHSPQCPRCNAQIEDWTHVLKCKHNLGKRKFLVNLKKALVKTPEFQMLSMETTINLEKMLYNTRQLLTGTEF